MIANAGRQRCTSRRFAPTDQGPRPGRLLAWRSLVPRPAARTPPPDRSPGASKKRSSTACWNPYTKMPYHGRSSN